MALIGEKQMNTYENEQVEAPDANDFLGGNYLRKEDIEEPVTVTVANVWPEAVMNSNRKKLVISFHEIEKPLILNKTNIKRLVHIFDTRDTSRWRGRITLYVEQGVEYAGRVVGGLRLKPAEQASSSETVPDQPTYANGRPEKQMDVEADLL